MEVVAEAEHSLLMT